MKEKNNVQRPFFAKREGTITFLLGIFLFVGSLFWLLSDYRDAQAEDLQKVITTAADNVEANAVIAQALKASPNPNKIELRQLQKKVNEIIVTDLARKVTGDSTLKPPSANEANQSPKASDPLSAGKSKSWSELNSDERKNILIKAGIVLLIATFGACYVFASTLRER
jgi:hypothetical protein